MTKPIPFSQIKQALLDDSTPFPPRFLHRFSDISPTDLRSLHAIWSNVSPLRKQTLLEDLEELAEADPLLSFEDLARALLNDSLAGVRIVATRLLFETPDVRLVPIFLGLLNQDPDDGVRAAAASTLGLFIQLGELEEIPEDVLHNVEEDLLSAARNGATTLIRRRALESLGASSRPEVPPLIESAYHEKSSEWIVSALFAMGRSGEERWGKQILAHLLSPEEEIRSESIRAAGELGLPGSRQALFDLLADEEDLVIRREIVWALSKIGGEGVRAKFDELLETETDEEEVDFLEEALENLLFTEELNEFSLFNFEMGEGEEEEEL